MVSPSRTKQAVVLIKLRENQCLIQADNFLFCPKVNVRWAVFSEANVFEASEVKSEINSQLQIPTADSPERDQGGCNFPIRSQRSRRDLSDFQAGLRSLSCKVCVVTAGCGCRKVIYYKIIQYCSSTALEITEYCIGITVAKLIIAS